MTNPDYCALCAELLVLAEESPSYRVQAKEAVQLIDRARAELAETDGPAVPVPKEVPRIGHILRLAEIIREVDGRHDKGAAALAEAILSHPGIRSAGLTAALAQPVAEGPTDEDLVEALRRLLMWPPRSTEAACEQDYTFARAVLARWGRPAAAPVPEPVAVSELGQQPVSQPYRLLLLGEVGA